MRPNGPDVHPSARIRGAGAPMRPIRSYHPFTSSVAPAAIGCLLFVLAPLEVEGQTPDGCGFDLRGGAAFPVGDVSEEMGPGGTLGAALDCQTRSPWTLRGGVELAYLTQEGGSYLAQATALGGGGLSMPVERWPMLLRARLEGGWMVPRWGASYTHRPPRPELVESGSGGSGPRMVGGTRLRSGGLLPVHGWIPTLVRWTSRRWSLPSQGDTHEDSLGNSPVRFPRSAHGSSEGGRPAVDRGNATRSRFALQPQRRDA
jgi:hypothetical protein